MKTKYFLTILFLIVPPALAGTAYYFLFPWNQSFGTMEKLFICFGVSFLVWVSVLMILKKESKAVLNILINLFK